MSALFSPFRQTYRYLQRSAHEKPVIFFSVVLGLVGPALVLAVPPVRRGFGYRPAEAIPTTYPVPKRARRAVVGYEDDA
ncbi:hypothetical protein FIBSPDRAFT_857931 [Athelia psychrophila]|uniref:NADH-ubiquinone oxidoreductase 9.5 kDa subunit n=1 Tax=Athelia psychrophila TaxID=1759441 RepID=A0A166MAB9_9AGAM|nr:hypothetical protein FIBSPDRAFT_857931 [Fibularhizoctonia sp. CBS 109695]